MGTNVDKYQVLVHVSYNKTTAPGTTAVFFFCTASPPCAWCVAVFSFIRSMFVSVRTAAGGVCVSQGTINEYETLLSQYFVFSWSSLRKCHIQRAAKCTWYALRTLRVACTYLVRAPPSSISPGCRISTDIGFVGTVLVLLYIERTV